MRGTTLTTIALASIILATAVPASRAFSFGGMPNASKPADEAVTNVASDDLGVAGVDIGNAGTSKQSRMTYLNSLIQETQGTVWARCGEIIRGADASADVMAFCNDVLPTR